MSHPAIQDELLQQLDRLPPDLQRQVLDFARALAILQPKGVRGEQLLEFAGTIEPDDLDAMSRAIEESCEQVDASDW
jgi:hypothetical protein